MANNKVQLANGTVLIDLTDTTATDSDVAKGKYFYNAAGVRTPGTAEGGGGSTPYVLITGEQDAGGGKVLHITGAANQTISVDVGGGDVDALSATVLLDISDLTVTAEHLESGFTAVNSMGNLIMGTM